MTKKKKPYSFRHKHGRSLHAIQGPWIVEGPEGFYAEFENRTDAAMMARKLNEGDTSSFIVKGHVSLSGRKHHATKKSPAQLQREIDEVIAKPSSKHATRKRPVSEFESDPAGVKLTASQRRTLGNIIALGGARGTGMGRDRPGAVRESVVLSLYKMGLVEPDPTGPRFPDDRSLILSTRQTVWQATAAGVRAFGPEVARVT